MEFKNKGSPCRAPWNAVSWNNLKIDGQSSGSRVSDNNNDNKYLSNHHHMANLSILFLLFYLYMLNNVKDIFIFVEFCGSSASPE